MRPSENKFNDSSSFLRMNGPKIRSTPQVLPLKPVTPEKTVKPTDGKTLFTVTVTLTEKGQQILNTLEHLICREFNITKEELKSEGRYMPLPKARGAFTSILRLKFDFPLKLIGVHLGGRDHSSILMAERRAKEFYKRNRSFRSNYDNIETTFFKFLSDNSFDAAANMMSGNLNDKLNYKNIG